MTLSMEQEPCVGRKQSNACRGVSSHQQPRRPSSSFMTSTRAPSPKAPGAALLAAAGGAVGPEATAACACGTGFFRAAVPPPLSRKGS